MSRGDKAGSRSKFRPSLVTDINKLGDILSQCLVQSAVTEAADGPDLPPRFILTHAAKKLAGSSAAPSLSPESLLVQVQSHSAERLRYRARLCRGAVEDEVHALLDCNAHPPFVDLRRIFLREILALDSALQAAHSSLSHYDFLRRMISSRKGVQRLAKFAFDVFTVFNAFERYRARMFLLEITAVNMFLPSFLPSFEKILVKSSPLDKTIVEAMARTAIEASTKRSARDYRALVWTMKSLIDDAELEPFMETIPDLLWGPTDRRSTYEEHTRGFAFAGKEKGPNLNQTEL
ncbi:hypothetical protein C8R44DRAFT_933907 [Mycena epipterygia]|nr:hypothetical protein C8R44DRAFT_933907 [Mycena epipterygia]